MTTIFVADLPFEVSAEDVRECFSQFGKVAAARLARDQAGGSRGYGFVEMRDEKAAGEAIAGLNGREWSGRPIHVGYARPRGKLTQ